MYQLLGHGILTKYSGKSGILSVSCVTCYVKGQAHATLTVSPEFNISSALKIFAEDFVTEIDNITDTVWNTFKNWTEVVVHNTSDAVVYDVEACTIKITSGHCMFCLPMKSRMLKGNCSGIGRKC